QHVPARNLHDVDLATQPGRRSGRLDPVLLDPRLDHPDVRLELAGLHRAQPLGLGLELARELRLELGLLPPLLLLATPPLLFLPALLREPSFFLRSAALLLLLPPPLLLLPALLGEPSLLRPAALLFLASAALGLLAPLGLLALALELTQPLLLAGGLLLAGDALLFQTAALLCRALLGLLLLAARTLGRLARLSLLFLAAAQLGLLELLEP